jgi:hypothetical protein
MDAGDNGFSGRNDGFLPVVFSGWRGRIAIAGKWTLV